MMCIVCSKLAFLYTKKPCIRCKGDVIASISVICEMCSFKEKVCTVCLKKVQNPASQTGGCGCGKK